MPELALQLSHIIGHNHPMFDKTLHAPSRNLLHELLFLPTNDAPLYRIPFSTKSQTQ
jgi:hypothetical protein